MITHDRSAASPLATGVQPDTSRPRVAVIVLTWNRVDDLVTCLDSFPCLEYPNYEVIVVDNASEDDTVAVVRERYRWVTLIVNDENLGYVGGNNVGMRYALARGFDYVFILNSDTTVTPSVLSRLVDVLEGDAHIAIAGAKNLLMENPTLTWGRYCIVTWGPMLVKIIGRFEPDYVEESPKDVPCVIGNACMMRRQALETVGLFDEAFFQVNEDLDWCLRAHKLGYRVMYVDSAAIHHKGASSGDASKPVAFQYGYFLGRNAILLARKHAGRIEWIKLVSLLTLGLVARSLFYAARAFIGTLRSDIRFLSGMVDGLRDRERRALAVQARRSTLLHGRGAVQRTLRWLGV